MVTDFVTQLCQENGDIAKRFICDFRTTGPVERMVSEIVLMEMAVQYTISVGEVIVGCWWIVKGCDKIFRTSLAYFYIFCNQ
ncbi:MAG: hypothetical protein D3910_11555 [Candidatus Electrothrix sp. ATG2]|nr:hypothetical protein [Candidatus Electrothrix sp. ATG2]